jgi:hypothetical protein
MKQRYLTTLFVCIAALSAMAQTTVELKHDCGPNLATGLGIGTGVFSAMVCFDDVELNTLYDDYAFTELKVFMLGSSSHYDSVVINLLEDYVIVDTVDGGGNPQTWIVSFGTTLYSANIFSEVVANQWTVHQLPDSIPIEAGKKYAVRVDIRQIMTGNVIALDSCEMVLKKGGWVHASNIPNGLQLYQFGAGYDHNLGIRATAEEEEEIIEPGIHDLQTGIVNTQAYPNPAYGAAEIRFDLLMPGKLQLHLFDVAGQLVLTMDAGELLNAGANSLLVDVSSLPSGAYSYQLIGETGFASGKLVVMH